MNPKLMRDIKHDSMIFIDIKPLIFFCCLLSILGAEKEGRYEEVRRKEKEKR
jgi:hypothetical protein